MAVRLSFGEILKIIVERGRGRDVSVKQMYIIPPGGSETIRITPSPEANSRIIPVFFDLDTDPDMSTHVKIINDDIVLFDLIHLNSKEKINFYTDYGKLIVTEHELVVELKSLEPVENVVAVVDFYGIETTKDYVDKIRAFYDKALSEAGL